MVTNESAGPVELNLENVSLDFDWGRKKICSNRAKSVFSGVLSN